MEITPFPFLDEEEISHFYNLLQDVEGSFNGNANLKKRRRKDGEEGRGGDDNENKKNNNQSDKDGTKMSALNDILASLIMLDEEEKGEQNQWVIESQQEKALFDANSKQKIQVLSDYQSDLQSYHSDLDEMDQLRTKRARSAATAVAAAAVDIAVSENPSQSGAAGSGPSSGQHRRLWVKDRSKAWWDRCNHPDFPEEEFRHAFRMSKATFDLICEALNSAVIKKNGLR